MKRIRKKGCREKKVNRSKNFKYSIGKFKGNTVTETKPEGKNYKGEMKIRRPPQQRPD